MAPETEQERRRQLALEDAIARQQAMQASFDLAFGIEQFLFRFSAHFQSPSAFPFLFWTDWLIRSEDGINIFRLGDPEIFKFSFGIIMERYFSVLPTGSLRFNLGGMNSTRPNSLASWELEAILKEWRGKVDFYLCDEQHFRPSCSLR